MSLTSSSALMSPPINRMVRSSSQQVTAIWSNEFQLAQRRAAWNTIIESTLLNWLRDPNQLQDDGFDAPSPMIIRLSLDFAEECRDFNWPAPTGIVADPNGGIVFELNEGELSEVFHVWEDGSIEYMEFHGAQLVVRSLVEEAADK